MFSSVSLLSEYKYSIQKEFFFILFSVCGNHRGGKHIFGRLFTAETVILSDIIGSAKTKICDEDRKFVIKYGMIKISNVILFVKDCQNASEIVNDCIF